MPDPFATLPTEISFHTLSFLNFSSIARASAVSKLWNQIAYSPDVWSALCLDPEGDMLKFTPGVPVSAEELETLSNHYSNELLRRRSETDPCARSPYPSHHIILTHTALPSIHHSLAYQVRRPAVAPRRSEHTHNLPDPPPLWPSGEHNGRRILPGHSANPIRKPAHKILEQHGEYVRRGWKSGLARVALLQNDRHVHRDLAVRVCQALHN
ncbi:hypothetical protein BC936DRAFT_144879 [Jimgerdemannia flammicorona]|uniref:F-box domain-containing protein n=1 Tax=Jimgerdemannia flammicorona TaxID=994334 RepID=A0A433DM56_9FUNG|nr:hypothetical protein BC936DRAFT_144879 [Jimgerdemannia flammicorona]